MRANLQEGLPAVLPYNLSIIVPTYREADNLPLLLGRLALLRPQFQNLEVLIMDDNSPDATIEVFNSLNMSDWARLITRKVDRGLSPAVIEGCHAAQYETLVVMDADLSHPPEAIPAMIQSLYEKNNEFVVGSRFCEGGGIDQDWSLFRRLNSWVATTMARPFTKIKDPMSGFFALRKEAFLNAEQLNPIGYKIGLELIVKCGFKRIAEVPIHFADRIKGESKLSAKEQIKYLRHLKRLADFKFGNYSFFVQFALVGTAGFLVDILAITFLTWANVSIRIGLGVSILAAMTTTFLLNRFLTFNHGEKGRFWTQYIQFVLACSVGAFVNYMASLWVVGMNPSFLKFPQIPKAVGAVAGMFFNFISARYIVFKKHLVVVDKKRD